MIKILCVSPLKFDGTSFYRAWGVFKDLEQKVGDVTFTDHIQKPGGWSWPDYKMFDVLFLQRPGTPEHLQVCKYCKQIGLKIWVDFDDNFFAMDADNRMYDAIDGPCIQRMLDIIAMSDVLTVSTEALKADMIARGAKYVEVVPNALDTGAVKPAKTFNHRRPQIPPNPHRQVYLWRGSDTHHMDVFDFLQPMSEAMAARPEVDWVFMGWRPRYLDHIQGKHPYRYIKADDIMNFWERLQLNRPELMHVVLTPNAFNLSKSNIAWIEATAAGAVCVAPAWPEWDRPGVMQYKSLEEYRDFLIGANDMKPADRWQESMDYIQENLLLSKVNRLRADLLEKLMNNWDFKMERPLPQTMIE